MGCIEVEGWTFPDEKCPVYPLLKILAEAVEIKMEDPLMGDVERLRYINWDRVEFWVRRA
jgi:hypothetical protein